MAVRLSALRAGRASLPIPQRKWSSFYEVYFLTEIYCQILLSLISSAGYLFRVISWSACNTNHFEAWRCENHKKGNSNHAEEWEWLMENFRRAEHHSWGTVTAGSYSVDLEFDSRLGDLLWISSATAYKFKDNRSNTPRSLFPHPSHFIIHNHPPIQRCWPNILFRWERNNTKWHRKRNNKPVNTAPKGGFYQTSLVCTTYVYVRMYACASVFSPPFPSVLSVLCSNSYATTGPALGPWALPVPLRKRGSGWFCREIQSFIHYQGHIPWSRVTWQTTYSGISSPSFLWGQ
jgi:hypothetical protein